MISKKRTSNSLLISERSSSARRCAVAIMISAAACTTKTDYSGQTLTGQVESIDESGNVTDKWTRTADGEGNINLSMSSFSVLTVAEKDAFAGHSLTLNGDVGVNFFLDMKKIGLTNDDIISGGKTITVTVDWAEGCDAKKPIDNSFTVSGSNYEDYLDQDDDSDTKGMFRVTCDVASAEMTCLIHVTATVTGDVNTYTDDYCVRDYCEYVIENSSDADLIALVKATLDYGATSQTAFEVNVDDLADEKLNGSDSRYAYDRCTVDAASIDEAIGAANPGKTASDMSKVAEDINAYWYTASVIFLSKNTLRHYFYRNDGTLGTVSGFDGVAQDYFYYAEKTDIAAAELDTLQSFTVGGVTFEYSALDYVKAVLASDTMEQKYLYLAAALFRYNQAANGYFDRT